MSDTEKEAAIQRSINYYKQKTEYRSKSPGSSGSCGVADVKLEKVGGVWQVNIPQQAVRKIFTSLNPGQETVAKKTPNYDVSAVSGGRVYIFSTGLLPVDRVRLVGDLGKGTVSIGLGIDGHSIAYDLVYIYVTSKQANSNLASFIGAMKSGGDARYYLKLPGRFTTLFDSDIREVTGQQLACTLFFEPDGVIRFAIEVGLIPAVDDKGQKLANADEFIDQTVSGGIPVSDEDETSTDNAICGEPAGDSEIGKYIVKGLCSLVDLWYQLLNSILNNF